MSQWLAEVNGIKLTEVDDIPGGFNVYSDGKWTALVKEFAASGRKAVRVHSDIELETPPTIERARVAMAVAAKKHGLPVKVCKREGQLFLVRENDE